MNYVEAAPVVSAFYMSIVAYVHILCPNLEAILHHPIKGCQMLSNSRRNIATVLYMYVWMDNFSVNIIHINAMDSGSYVFYVLQKQQCPSLM